MGKFSEAFDKIADGIKDLSSLEVVTYRGTIAIDSGGEVPTKFKAIIDGAKATGDFKITACTYSELDGDMQVFYDKDLTASELDAHHKLVESARKSRQAVVDVFKNAILNEI